MAVDVIPAYLLVQAVVLTIAGCIFITVVIYKRKRLRTPTSFPASILYIAIAVIDVVAAVLWTLPTALITLGIDWIDAVGETVGGMLCKVQLFFMIFCHLMNGYILAALMFERFLRFYIPSKHAEIFFDLVVLIFIASLAVFNAVIAGFPTWGFGKAEYFPDHYQCGVDYPFSVSHFKFALSMEYALPFLTSLTFYVAIIIRFCILKKRRAPNGDMIVEHNPNVVGDSYSDRLKELYLRFKDAGSKSSKPKVKDDKGYNVDGYRSDEDDSYSSDGGENGADKPVDDYETPKEQQKQKKTYYLARNDVMTAHMYFLMALVYFAFWTPYIVWNVIYTYYYYDIPVSKTFTVAAVILTHYGGFVKIPFYLLSIKMRKSILKTIRCGGGRRSKSKTKTYDAPHAEQREQTTEL